MNPFTTSASESISESICGLASTFARRQQAARARDEGSHGYVVRPLGGREAWCYDPTGALIDARHLAGEHGAADVLRVEHDGTVGDLVTTVRGPAVVATVTALPCPRIHEPIAA